MSGGNSSRRYKNHAFPREFEESIFAARIRRADCGISSLVLPIFALLVILAAGGCYYGGGETIVVV